MSGKYARKPEPRSRQDVVLYLSTDSAYAREIIRGAVDYALHRHAWQLLYDEGPGDQPRRFRRYRHFHGVITHANTDEMRRAVVRLGVPTVLVEQDSFAGLPVVRGDDWAVGRLAADHLADQGFRHAAFWGRARTEYARRREEGFFEEAASRGMHCCPQPESPWGACEVFDGGPHDRSGWLRALPKPVGILCHNTSAAREMAITCRELGLYVPEEIALVGVDDDELACNASLPPLTAINQGTYMIGYRAATLLDELMAGGSPPEGEIRVLPSRLTPRQSTDALALEDPDLARAVQLIRGRALGELQVADVLAEIPVARRTLEMKFRRTLGRSIHEEINRVRIDHAKRLLLETNLAMPDLAIRCGFNYATVFTKVFRQMTGTTPKKFRHANGPA